MPRTATSPFPCPRWRASRSAGRRSPASCSPPAATATVTATGRGTATPTTTSPPTPRAAPTSTAAGESRPGSPPASASSRPPTGVALLRGLAATAGPQPMLVTEALGVGAGTKDTPGRPNVVRVLVGRAQGNDLPADAHATPTAALQLEANVDDLDPRLWPRVIEELLETGALDAWLVPISMKHGRPAVTVHALVREGSEDAAATLLMDRTGTLGVRRHRVERVIRTREFTEVEVRGHRIAVKIARDQDGAVVRREPEFRDVAAAARALRISERTMLDLAREAAAGLAGS
ncbi:LarC family nickel insertion protein [Brachybacterium sp. Z12]|uniref:LarC family nickel insertion protein n=1 Tax=Brachybacterium sp. Z12 TaxID=2759167 RepID=UPI00223AF5AE|nr:LarC family nickel insertion protein [Brachybacterium sp. Z12]